MLSLRPWSALIAGLAIAQFSFEIQATPPQRFVPGDLEALSAKGGRNRTENSVIAALKWLALHQATDGIWRFDPPAGGERVYANPGTWKSDAGATGLCLLPFLGTGQSHKSQGPFKPYISLGLSWLLKHQKPDGDLSAGGTPKVLSHAWATLALSEAYGLSGDKEVGIAAQKAIDFIANSQDKKSGGWRESLGDSPRLSVTAWQLMALRSGHVAGLSTSSEVNKAAMRFVAQLGDEKGVTFGETSKSDVNCRTTAMGHLIGLGSYSMQDGNLPLSSPDQAKLRARRQAARDYLLKNGPSTKEAVFNLYATIFLQQERNADWNTWNSRMREQTIRVQVKEGDEKGSWFASDDNDAATGGRLFQTAINSLFLEGYYRYALLFK